MYALNVFHMDYYNLFSSQLVKTEEDQWLGSGRDQERLVKVGDNMC